MTLSTIAGAWSLGPLLANGSALVLLNGARPTAAYWTAEAMQADPQGRLYIRTGSRWRRWNQSTFVPSAAPAGTGVNLAMLLGNATGVYAAPGITTATQLLYGFAAIDQQASSAFNFRPINYVLALPSRNQVQIPENGWYTAADQIIDPTVRDWTGYALVWFYQ